MFLTLEASSGQADMPDSLMDRVLSGLVSERGGQGSLTFGRQYLSSP